MRKIEQEMVAAFRAANTLFTRGLARSWKNGNTEVRVGSATIAVYLHGHAIFQAVYPEAPSIARYRLEFSLAGWNTPTTRSRINALLDAYTYTGGRQRVYSQKGQPRWFREYSGGSYDQVLDNIHGWHTVRSEP